MCNETTMDKVTRETKRRRIGVRKNVSDKFNRSFLKKVLVKSAYVKTYEGGCGG